jgi:hypothetical protein
MSQTAEKGAQAINHYNTQDNDIDRMGGLAGEQLPRFNNLKQFSDKEGRGDIRYHNEDSGYGSAYPEDMVFLYKD